VTRIVARANDRVVQYLGWGNSDWNRARDETFGVLRPTRSVEVVR